ncbi:unnamed protein product [Cuscuta epithymum]|uniref:Zinc finger GRF-type domain-containing protein n=1 Tax=Cuscuta epithymum TaxID=186058 RepID=A0AAV0FBL3_9ASTE|nr:unnamed protein product [Cuscuta epithymum]
MSSSSASTASKGQRSTLEYEPAVYCFCGLKAPLCVGRDSGRSFYGCQKWKGHGCDFFEWQDAIPTKPIRRGEDMMIRNTDELKVLISGLVDHHRALEHKVCCLTCNSY